MTAAALLAELEAAGINLTREGDNLRVRAQPGVSLAPYVERIRAHKPELLKEVLQRRIVEALNAEPENFNRAEYDHLWRLWHVQDAKEESTS